MFLDLLKTIAVVKGFQHFHPIFFLFLFFSFHICFKVSMKQAINDAFNTVQHRGNHLKLVFVLTIFFLI